MKQLLFSINIRSNKYEEHIPALKHIAFEIAQYNAGTYGLHMPEGFIKSLSEDAECRMLTFLPLRDDNFRIGHNKLEGYVNYGTITITATDYKIYL
ncbi:hypothetical protein [Segetibacter koreensis]|uniref:hypothetical protein n=1 Tax=Segetibacter koreensis TaxID=398037 RepID=UPI00037E7661|nr:hypothetical protein [Segetibacter koreensis]